MTVEYAKPRGGRRSGRAKCQAKGRRGGKRTPWRKRLRRWFRRSSRWVAHRCTQGVLLLQGAVLLTFAVTPTWWQPPPGDWLVLLWAWLRRPQFYPLVAVLIGGPALTIIAAMVPGWHRLTLALAWVAFTIALFTGWGDRVETMLWVLWWRVTG